MGGGERHFPVRCQHKKVFKPSHPYAQVEAAPVSRIPCSNAGLHISLVESGYPWGQCKHVEIGMTIYRMGACKSSLHVVVLLYVTEIKLIAHALTS